MHDSERADLARRLRQLSHDFVARDLSAIELASLDEPLAAFEKILHDAPLRSREIVSQNVSKFRMPHPDIDDTRPFEFFSDSFISGLASPSGVGGALHRDGEVAVMDASIGKAFEGSPGRVHGGIIASLLDETMGWVLGFTKKLAFTAQLDITFVSPTPIETPIQIRAWLGNVDGKKFFVEGVVSQSSDGTELARGKALFIEIDPAKFLENLIKT
jgi:acyl-coenzyme A thioesterase PaaI-like protein